LGYILRKVLQVGFLRGKKRPLGIQIFLDLA